MIIPPLQSPDEPAHITQAAVISHGSFFGMSVDNTTLGGHIDAQFQSYFNLYESLRGNSKQLSPALRADGNALLHSGQTGFAATPATAFYLPIIYLPQALGLTIGRRANLSIDTTIRLARAFALLASSAILYGALRLYVPNMFVLTLLLMPMYLFQIACSGIDGVTTAVAVFALGYFMRSAEKSWQPSIALDWAFGLALLLLATTRQHLMPMLLLPFFLYFVRRETKLLATGVTLLVLTFAWTAYIMISTRDAAPSVLPTLMHYLHSPAAALTILSATIFNFANLRDNALAFIGILGWLDTPLQSSAYKLTGGFVVVALGLSFNSKSNKADWHARIFLLALCIISGALVFIIMMVVWTKLPASQIQGVQGRYFLVPALVFGYALSGAKTAIHYRHLQLALLCGFALFTTTNTAYVMFDRHYPEMSASLVKQR